MIMTEEGKVTGRLQRRKELEKEKKLEKGTNDTGSTKWVQIRLIPIWLRLIIVIILLGIAGAIGLTVGYGIIGEGSTSDALKWETYQHMLDILSGK